MLHQTTPHQSPLSPFNSSSPPQGMDCVEKELKLTHHHHHHHRQSSVDEFFVDDFLDLSNGFAEDETEILDEQPHGFNTQKACSVSPQKQLEKREAENGDFGSIPAGELSIPENGLDNLEWLSHFVEESYSDHPAGKLLEKPFENRSEKENPVRDKSWFKTPVQTRARTKRTRTGGRVWSLGSVSFTGSSTSSTSSSFSSSTAATTSLCLSQSAESIVQKRRKKAAGKPVKPRRCSHCGVQKTPQWRAGPMGAKTLCNACGVRFKSGRLLPEYRPACSPTFSSEQHSNNHRKVLEMRRKKEAEAGGFAPPVQSF